MEQDGEGKIPIIICFLGISSLFVNFVISNVLAITGRLRSFRQFLVINSSLLFVIIAEVIEILR